MPERTDPAPECRLRRRALLQGVACAAALALRTGEAAAPGPARLPPQKGDLLALLGEDGAVRAVTREDLPPAGEPLLVYPLDAANGVLRRGSRLNQILLLRLEPSTLDAVTARHAIDGVVAYSGVCTHAACAVSEWKAATRRLICPCHGSEYDPAAHAVVTTGPAPRPLPLLPIASAGQHYAVAGPFTARVGIRKP